MFCEIWCSREKIGYECFFAYAIVLGILMRGVNPDITQLFTLERDLYEQCPQTFGWFMDQKHWFPHA